MPTDKPTFFLILGIWLLPVASLKLLVFGWPLYPIEIVLLAALPFFPVPGWREAWLEPRVKAIALFAGLLFVGTLLAYSAYPSLAGLGQLKSFFFFPILWYFFVVSLLREQNVPRVLAHWRYMLLIAAAVALFSGLFGGFTYDHRLRAWFDSPNLLALFLLPGAVLWWSEMLLSPQQRFKTIFFWGIMMFALIFTRSYGVLLAALVSSIVLLWISRGYRVSVLISWRKLWAILGVVLLVFVGTEIQTDKWTMLFSGNERSSLESRIMIWKAATKMLMDQPVFGIGPGRFQETYLAYQMYYPPYLEWAVPHPHNLWLAFWLSSGILGLVALLWLLSILIFFGRRLVMDTKKSLYLAILVAFFVAGLLDVPYFRAEFCYAFWLALALLSSPISRVDKL